jgi:hypothetical protein
MDAALREIQEGLRADKVKLSLGSLRQARLMI